MYDAQAREGDEVLTPSQRWTATWLDPVVDGRLAMSQRRLTSIEKYGGSVESVKAMAIARGVHLMQLTDDKGDVLVAASLKPFQVIC
jgi:hypothetical protein